MRTGPPLAARLRLIGGACCQAGAALTGPTSNGSTIFPCGTRALGARFFMVCLFAATPFCRRAASSTPIKALALPASPRYDDHEIDRRGRTMKLVIGLFVVAVMLAASAGLGPAIWSRGIGHNDASLRVIHYGADYEMSARRREQVR